MAEAPVDPRDDDGERLHRPEAEVEGLLQEEERGRGEGEQMDGFPMQQQPPLPPPPVAPRKSFFSYRSVSFLAFSWLVYSAFRTRKQYYLAMMYLSSSKWAYVVTGNAVLALAMTVFDATVHAFLGGLRQHEAEGLQDFFRWNVTETCLALTMFRAELTIGVALQFVALILIKCLHHVAGLRELHLRLTEEAVDPTSFFLFKKGHGMILVFIVLLSLIDMRTLQLSAMSLMKSWPSVSILFAFEAAIMLTSAWSHMLLWGLHVVDSLISTGHEMEVPLATRLFHPWKEHKATLIFAVELQAQAVTFLFYCTFFLIVLSFYGMPINLFREVYMSFTALKERLGAFMKYRRLMASMDRFKSATEEELAATEQTCIICRDEMHVGDCKRLPGCGHIFHKSCLREWLVQQQTCPTCRSDITAMEARERERDAAAGAAAEREAVQELAVQEAVGPEAAVQDEEADLTRDQQLPLSTGANLEEVEPPVPQPFDDFILFRVCPPATVWSLEAKTPLRSVNAFLFVVGKKGSWQVAGAAAIRIPDGLILEQDVEEVTFLKQFSKFHRSVGEDGVAHY